MNTLFEQNGCNYEIQGNYQLPCIATKEQNELHIGVWATRHRQYLKQHHRIRYYNLLTSERLYGELHHQQHPEVLCSHAQNIPYP